MNEAAVARWLKKAGDSVKTGEALFEVETEKVATEVPSPGEGILSILVPEGKTVPIGTPLALLAAPGEQYDAYVAAVRAEYAAVPEQEFLAGRLAVLQPLADGEIFRSGKAQSLKAAARENLERELWSLRDRLGLEQPDGDAVEDSPS